jgi:crotonobetainyl-CoA:carnitine CoA-transferase CaiB-like acyl-CoA transferase
VAKRLGVDYESISRINPQIVYCSLSGYGQNGPYRDLPGHDINYISIAGALGMIGNSPDSPPAIPLNLVADFAGGSLHAVIGILLSLMAREKIGRGQYVDIAMIDGVISLLGFSTYEYFCSGRIPQRGDDMLNGGFPCYNVYQSKDGGYISIGCIEAHFWENLCRALGREDFIPHQWSQDGEKQEEIFCFLRKTFLTKTRDEWFELLKNTVPTGKVYSMGETFTDPQVLHREMMVEIDHPEAGKVKQAGIGIKLSQTPGQIRSLAPSPGEHNEEMLSTLGYTEKDIKLLQSQKII